MGAFQERRRHPRIPVDGDAAIEVGGVGLAGTIHNISEGGAFVSVRRTAEVELSSQVHVQVMLLADNPDQGVEVPGRIVHVRPHANEIGLGIEFDHSQLSIRAILNWAHHHQAGELDLTNVQQAPGHPVETERRRGPRVPLAVVVEGEEVGIGYSRDISHYGLYIDLRVRTGATEPQDGDKLTLRFRIPKARHLMVVPGCVMRVQRDDSGEIKGLGIAFEHLAPEQKQQLDDFINNRL